MAMPSSRDLPDPGIELEFLMSPALASKFFTINTIWTAGMASASSSLSVLSSFSPELGEPKKRNEGMFEVRQ